MQNTYQNNKPLPNDQLWADIQNLPPASQSEQDFSPADFQDFAETCPDAGTENLKSCKPEESAEPAGDDLPDAAPEIVAEPETLLPWSQAVETCIQFGLPVMPVDPKTGEVAVAGEEWKAGYSAVKAREHFALHPEHKPALVLPADTIAFRTQDEVARKALWNVFVDGNTAPSFRLQVGDAEICVFRWMREGRLASSLTVRHDAEGQIEILYPDFTLKTTDPEMVVAACHVESLANLDEIDAGQLAEILRFNRNVVTAALECNGKAENHPLGRYSLRGQSSKIKEEMVAAVDVLPGIARRGQATMLFAAPNTGKTLIVLYLIIEAIKSGLLEPSHLFYVNVDDNTEGLYEKLLLAEKYGFHMLSEGYEGYQAKHFTDQVHALIKSGAAPQTVVILDTLKRFAEDILDKRKNSQFTGLMRLLSLKGGTVIALGHVNKAKGKDGSSTYAGTSDLLDDVDRGFVIDEVNVDRATQRKFVEFRRRKGRGNVSECLAFSYSVEEDQSYAELLASVEEINPASLEPMRQAAALNNDMPVVRAIEASIHEGKNAKMAIITGVANKTKVSQRNVGTILERYTGEDPAQHRWTYQVRERGAKVYVLLETDQPEPSD